MFKTMLINLFQMSCASGDNPHCSIYLHTGIFPIRLFFWGPKAFMCSLLILCLFHSSVQLFCSLLHCVNWFFVCSFFSPWKYYSSNNVLEKVHHLREKFRTWWYHLYEFELVPFFSSHDLIVFLTIKLFQFPRLCVLTISLTTLGKT